MQGDPVKVTARVSNGSGNPGEPDYAPDVRGLAVSFHLADGSATDIVSQSAPRFPVKTTEEFFELLEATRPSLSSAVRLPLFLATHPTALRSMKDNVAAIRPPPSYASCRYFPVHAYRWVASDGSSTHVRYTWLPEREEARLSPGHAKPRGRDYLQEEMAERLQGGVAKFTLQVQLAEEGDDVDDPSSRWPEDRKRVDVGSLELDALAPEIETDGGVVVFDPVRVTDGIELSNDPILLFRPKAYSASVEHRLKA